MLLTATSNLLQYQLSCNLIPNHHICGQTLLHPITICKPSSATRKHNTLPLNPTTIQQSKLLRRRCRNRAIQTTGNQRLKLSRLLLQKLLSPSLLSLSFRILPTHLITHYPAKQPVVIISRVSPLQLQRLKLSPVLRLALLIVHPHQHRLNTRPGLTCTLRHHRLSIITAIHRQHILKQANMLTRIITVFIRGINSRTASLLLIIQPHMVQHLRSLQALLLLSVPQLSITLRTAPQRLRISPCRTRQLTQPLRHLSTMRTTSQITTPRGTSIHFRNHIHCSKKIVNC